MKGFLVSMIFSAVILAAAYGFAATLSLTGVDNLGNQSETVEFNNDVGPTTCTITGGIDCSVA